MRFGILGTRGYWKSYNNLNEKCNLGELWGKVYYFELEFRCYTI